MCDGLWWAGSAFLHWVKTGETRVKSAAEKPHRPNAWDWNKETKCYFFNERKDWLELAVSWICLMGLYKLPSNQVCKFKAWNMLCYVQAFRATFLNLVMFYFSMGTLWASAIVLFDIPFPQSDRVLLVARLVDFKQCFLLHVSKTETGSDLLLRPQR